MDVGLAAARALLPGVALDVVDELQAGERSRVRRVHAAWPDREPGTVIVKEFRQAGEGWVREAAALSVLPPGGGSALVTAGREPPLIVTEDLGTGPSLADALLGDDAEVASGTVRRWAEAVARVHVGGAGAREAFEQALAERAGDLPVAASRVSVEIDDAVRVLDGHCASLGVPVPSGALDELRSLARRLGDDGPASITPADTCPDNNVRVGDRLVLIDFEGAQWRHIAWDVAYLFVPWPTCWCSWRMPDRVAAAAFDAYREAAATAFPYVGSPAFERDVEAAVVGWAFASLTWFLDNALGDDAPLHPDVRTPTRRAMIRHRLGVAAATEELPALAELAHHLDDVLAARWEDKPLGYARAFADSG